MTQTFAFIGRKGSGKTHAAGKLAELLIDSGAQVAILDTVGNWYGLRLAADGKSAGIDIPILGGLRGDIPLEATGGALIAEALVESGRSLLIDLSQFSKADRQRFAVALGERLWRLKKADRHPAAVSREELSEGLGYATSTRNAYIHRLLARKLVVDASDGVRASDELF